MIGIVAVSHSAALGEAALQLALQMVPGGGVLVRAAAGAGTDADGAPILGTDAMAVADAIDALAAEASGIVVLMDLGSAVLSAELALELRSSTVPVRLTAAPFVEGLLAGVVAAGAGGDLDTVAAEASSALLAKTEQLGEPDAAQTTADAGTQDSNAGADAGSERPAVRRTVLVRNPLGIHARPAALIAAAAAGSPVKLRRLPDGLEVPASSLMRLLTLGATQGTQIELSADGDDAADAVARVAKLFEEAFGEGEDAGPQDAATTVTDSPPPAAAPAPALVAAGAELHGRGVSPGRAAATVARLHAAPGEPSAEEVIAPQDRAAQAASIRPASDRVAAQLLQRAEATDGEAAEILRAAALMATDPELLADAAERVLSGGQSAPRALWDAVAERAAALSALGGTMAERVTDLRDVRNRLIAALSGEEAPGVPDRADPFVLIATDLAPADTATLGRTGCVALVTEQGGPTSHTAIIARALGLPAVVGVEGATGIRDGEIVLVDGSTGSVEVAPTAERVAEATAATADAHFDGDARLADGQALPLLANVGGAGDAEAAAAAKAQGVGLFRTEFLFLDRATAPSRAEQVAAYRGVLAAFPGRKVVARTLDAGSDKPLPFANPEREENPALGVRGLRIARRRPELLAEQLRALAEAARHERAHLEVMAPMVATVAEAQQFADQARAAGIDRVGVMIETPAAALMAAELMRVVDFVSLGTNDLAQYTMAADRLLSDLGDLNDPWQPAVLRLIGMVAEAGRASGRDVGVCGEAGGDPELAPVLAGLGVTSLSMTARSLGRVAEALAAVTAEQCRAAAASALSASTAEEARAAASAALVR